MGIFTLLGKALAFIGRAAVFPFRRISGSPTASRWFRWVIHFVFLAAVLVGLAMLNYALGLETVVRSPWPALRSLWLPLLFLLVYALVWLGWWIYKLMTTPSGESPYPDIDDAWYEALAALDQANISLDRTPLFLVLGRTAAPETYLTTSSGLAFTVPQAPRDKLAPLHVSASEEGIFLTVPGVSLLSYQASLFAQQAEDESRRRRQQARQAYQEFGRGTDLTSPWPSDLAKGTTGDVDVAFDDPTALPGDEAAAAEDDLLMPSQREVRARAAQGLDTLEPKATALDEPTPATITSATKFSPMPGAPRRQAAQDCEPAPPKLLKELDQIEEITNRLQHLCRLIQRARRPYCPINGVICLIPLAATSGDAQANQTAVLLQRDLDAMREIFQVKAPLYTLVCDLEQAPGCRELLERFPQEQRHRRLGALLPNLAACDLPQAPAVAAKALAWICRSLLPALVYRLIRVGTDGTASREEQGNVRLFYFLDDMRQREPRLLRILTRGVLAAKGDTWRLQGCFLAATGADASREQGFIEGVFPQLLETQDQLAWTEEALAEDAGCRRWATIGYVGLVIFLIVMVAIGITI